MTQDQLFLIGTGDRLSPAFWDAFPSLYEHILSLLREDWCSGFVILKTCQRFEIYGTARGTPPLEALHRFSPLFPGYVLFENAKVARHLFRITAGLESALFGEVHILGQVKRAWEYAWQKQHTSKILNVLFHTAIRVGKKLRRYLPKEEHLFSFGALVAEILEREYPLPASTVTLFGWGMLGRSVAGALRARGVQRIFVYTRHPDHLPQDPRLIAIQEEEKFSALSQSQAVVCASNAPRYTITRDVLCHCTSLPRVFVDLAVPPNIDPQVSCLVEKLYAFEDILSLARERTLPFTRDLAFLESLIEEEVVRFMKTLKGFEADPLIQRILPLLQGVFEEKKRSVLLELYPETREALAQLLDHLYKKTVRKTAESIRGFFEER